MNVIKVIGLGLGPEHLTPAIRAAVGAAATLAGGRRLLDLFPDFPGQRLALAGPMTDFLDALAGAAQAGPVVVVASGDPGFYGIGRRLIEHFGTERVELVPNVTTVQAGLARLGLPWDRAAVVSLHGRPLEAVLPALLESDLIAVYTDPANSPAKVANLLLERGQTGWRGRVLENLGQADERSRAFDLPDLAAAEFAPLNLLVLERTGRPEPLGLGTPDDAFEHAAGLITKQEVRAVALAKLDLRPELTLWDLGAGCGSVGLTASRLVFRGQVIAVERDEAQLTRLRNNQARFGAANLAVVRADLPEGLGRLADPDRVFVGGGGPALGQIIAVAWSRLPVGGRLVVSAVRLEAVETARQGLAGLGAAMEVCQVQLGRGADLAGGVYLKALNPVWLITGLKE